VPKVSTLLRLAQFTFWAALIFTFVCAVLPSQHVIHLFKWDKAEHFLAFYVLTGLAVAAFPHGSLIHYSPPRFPPSAPSSSWSRGFSFVGRDRDFQDWVTDTIAIGMAMAPMLAVWWRAQVGREESARQ
jgi:hypothetical protein